jgi:hypothetical protein
VLSVGITGHRSDGLDAAASDALAGRLRELLELLGDASADLLERERDCFADAPILRRFISPIADGADQIAAEVALDLGWDLQLVLPFARAH